MDAVDESADLAALSDLKLPREDTELLKRLASRFDSSESKYLLIHRGFSTAVKIVLKPARLFPFLVKIDLRDEIRAEHSGDQLIRLRVPPLSIPPSPIVEEGDARAALMYRYITGGRVKDVVDRLDVYLGKAEATAGSAALAEVLDVILKKCHWLDGDSDVRALELTALSPPSYPISSQLRVLVEKFNRMLPYFQSARAPHGMVHGDLHPKNVLITRHNAPVLIDFRSARKNECVYFDYSRLKTYIQFQVPQLLAAFNRVTDRIYSPESLILPRSSTALAHYIHTIRSVLWRNCLSQTVNLSSAEIEIGYRGCLTRSLLAYSLHSDRSEENRCKAQRQAAGLLDVPC